MPRDMICVYRAADVGEADIVAAWLAEKGITVHVKDRFAAGTMQTPLIVAPKGIEICVVDPEVAEQARALVREHVEHRREKTDEAAGGTIEAVCEECGNVSRFSFKQRGTVQTCPHCRQYIDVPETSEGDGL